MPMFNFSCNKCGFTDEYSTNKSLPKSMRPPKKCPTKKCNGKMIRQFSPNGISFDVVGGYDYTYGKKAWKKNLSVSEQADVLAGDKEPY